MTTITDQIDGLIFDLPLDVKIKIRKFFERKREIYQQKEKTTVRLFFFNEKFNPLIPPAQKKYKMESVDKKNEFLRLIKSELEIRFHEMIFN